MLKTLISKLFLYVGIVCFLTVNIYSQDSDYLKRSKEIINYFKSGEVDKIHDQFDTTMAKTLTTGRLEPIWDNLQKQYGKFEDFGEQDSSTQGNILVVNTDLNYEKAIMNFRTSYRLSTDELAGIYFSEEKRLDNKNEPKILPSYIDTNSFSEKDVRIEDIYELKGKLALPDSNQKDVAFVFVPGSGPTDMDATVGSNKFFRNLAWGFASMGYPSIRYDKITQRYSREIMKNHPDFTIQDEYHNSINSAISILQSDESTKDSKIYLIGHSQGASVITDYAENDSVSGLILLAGTPRELYEIYGDQLKYIFNLDNNISVTEANLMKEHKTKVEYFLRNKEREISKDSLPMNLPYEYLISEIELDPVSNLIETNKPVLIINGGKDYQVTEEDFKIWKSSLSSNNNIELKYLENLNHIFAKSEEMSKPSDYSNYMPIAPILFEEIKKWLNNE